MKKNYTKFNFNNKNILSEFLPLSGKLIFTAKLNGIYGITEMNVHDEYHLICC